MNEHDVPASEGLRLSQVVLRLGAGGTERLVIDMSRRLLDRADVQVVCLDDEGEWAGELQDAGVRVTALHRQPGFRPSLARRVSDLVREHRSNVVHCHHYTPYVYGALAARQLSGLRVIYTEHGRLSEAEPTIKRRLANLYFGRLPGTFVAVSSSMRSHMRSAGFPDKRLIVIHNGIDPGTAPSPEERAGARERLNIPSKNLVLGTIARLDPVKDLQSLIRAFARLRSKLCESTLVVIGGGPEDELLRSVARQYEVGDSVRFVGHQDNARALLPALDIFVNCSLVEGISITILEAMAAELPVIATHVGGNPEVVQHGKTGLLVPARQPEALYEAMAKLSSDHEMMRTLASTGRHRVVSHFSFDQMLRRYLSVYGPQNKNGD